MNPKIVAGPKMIKRTLIIPTKEKHIKRLTVYTLNKKK